jgi:hypothetical protein
MVSQVGRHGGRIIGYQRDAHKLPSEFQVSKEAADSSVQRFHTLHHMRGDHTSLAVCGLQVAASEKRFLIPSCILWLHLVKISTDANLNLHTSPLVRLKKIDNQSRALGFGFNHKPSNIV